MQVFWIIEYNEQKYNIHVMDSNVSLIHEMEGNFEDLSHKPRPQPCGRIVLKFYKKQMKSENYNICRDIMISYAVAKVNNWEGFVQVIMYAAYKSKHLRRRSMELWRSLFRFWVKVTVELGFDYEIFCICNRQFRLFHAKFWLFFGAVW